MQRERVVRFREALEQTIVQHGARAGHGFLGRLGDEHQRAVPLVFQFGERARGAEPGGHVDVVT
jgi:hypothetical protein